MLEHYPLLFFITIKHEFNQRFIEFGAYLKRLLKLLVGEFRKSKFSLYFGYYSLESNKITIFYYSFASKVNINIFVVYLTFLKDLFCYIDLDRTHSNLLFN